VNVAEGQMKLHHQRKQRQEAAELPVRPEQSHAEFLPRIQDYRTVAKLKECNIVEFFCNGIRACHFDRVGRIPDDRLSGQRDWSPSMRRTTGELAI
jgi:hypothetical protein